jgi:aryl-alcohol dehydrogenase-like predicted oxidoreductase
LSYEVNIPPIKEVSRLFLTKILTVAFTKMNPWISWEARLERVKTVYIDIYQ